MFHGLFLRQSENPADIQAIEDIRNDLVLSPERHQFTSWHSASVWMGQEGYYSETPPSDAIWGDPETAVITGWVRLDNREDLAQKLAISPDQLETLSCAHIVLSAYLKFGADCVNNLYGDYSFAIYDVLKKEFFCVRDHLGTRPFYYYLDDGLLAFSATQAFFHRVPSITLQPRREWAALFLIGHSMDFKKTAYNSIFKLPPGHLMCIKSETHELIKYHEFSTAKKLLPSSKDYIDRYRTALETAIQTRSDVNHPLGSECSGGLDSSTTTCFAHRYFKGDDLDFHTFAQTYLEHEPKQSLLVNQRLGLPVGHVSCDLMAKTEDVKNIMRIMGAPVEHSNATGHVIFYDIAAKHHVRTLLSGFGGDEFVTSIHGDLYLHELMADKKWLTLLQTLHGNFLTRFLRFIKLLWQTRGAPGHPSTHMSKSYSQRWPHKLVHPKLVNQFSLKKIDEKAGSFIHTYDNLDRFTLEKRWVPFVTTRMENCSVMAASYGIEYRWPLLDTRLIQTFLSTPTDQKYHKGLGRYLHRRAIEGVVPESIIQQRSKYMGEPLSPRSFNLPFPGTIHPDLAKIIDQDKLQKQRAAWDIARKAQTKKQPPHIRQIAQNISRIKALNDWLYHFYPSGCDWEID